ELGIAFIFLRRSAAELDLSRRLSKQHAHVSAFAPARSARRSARVIRTYRGNSAHADREENSCPLHVCPSEPLSPARNFETRQAVISSLRSRLVPHASLERALATTSCESSANGVFTDRPSQRRDAAIR